MQLEQELIKRHNIKMMNEMQEVVRQIKQAKTKNDEVLRDYHKKQTDLTRSVLEVVEKFASMKAELDEIKRQAALNKQQLNHRCDQTTDQVAQLKHAVFTAWQKEKAEIQQKVSQNYRGDLALVLGQFDAKLRENFQETSKVRHDIRRLTARMNGEDPDAITYEVPSYQDTSVPADEPIQESAAPAEPVAPAAAATATPVNLSSLTQNLAAFISKQQTAGAPAGGAPQVNVAMLQQFMQTLPRQQQLQLQMLLQQHRAGQTGAAPSAAPVVTPAPSSSLSSSAPAFTPASHSAAPQATMPVYAPAAAAPTQTAAAPAASMIQSLAHQLQLQVNAAKSKASSLGAGTVNCPFFSMFGWCKFGERCHYIHTSTGKEPLRNLPLPVIQTLQQQLSSGSTEQTTQTLMTALAGVAARQAEAKAAPPPGLAGPPGLTKPAAATSSMNSVQEAMIQAQIKAQQEAAQLGAAKAKLLPCRFFSIGRCAYGDRCGYNHAVEVPTTGAAAAAAAWGKSGLQNTASWGAPVSAPKEEELIVDGEDDTSYDQWNAMTFDEKP